MGSIEGRVAIETFDEMQYKISNKPLPTNPGQKPKSFAFKFHRWENDEENPFQLFRVSTFSFSTYLFFCYTRYYNLTDSYRDEADIFSVNAVDFHKYNTFCTAGSDGTFAIWDKEAK